MVNTGHSSSPPADRVLSWMASLADATRVRLVRLLERHELGVVELCDVLQKPQPTVSRHLKVLGDHGWVSSRRQGTGRLYRTVLDELDPAARKLWVLTREQTDAWPTVRQDALRLDRVLRDRAVDRDAFFDTAAGEWDGLRRQLYGERFNLAVLAAMLPADAVVADLGCGTGVLAAELAPAVGRVVGVDGSAAMLRSAKRRVAGLGNVELLRGDLAAVAGRDRLVRRRPVRARPDVRGRPGGGVPGGRPGAPAGRPGRGRRPAPARPGRLPPSDGSDGPRAGAGRRRPDAGRCRAG